MKYQSLILKNHIENVFIFPFILLGYIVHWITRKIGPFDTFFFFPFYHTGGAEKVHLQIVEAVGNSNCIIFFTRRSAGKTFYQSFTNTNCKTRDISRFTDNKYLYFLNLACRGYLAAMINGQKTKPIVFNGQCNFAYKISPWLHKEVIQIELIHALNTFSYIRLPFLRFYTKCLTVSQEIVDKHRMAYQKLNVPQALFSKFTFIETRIELPVKAGKKNYDHTPLQVLYVGRGTPEKRVHMVATIAALLAKEGVDAKFNFAGEVQDSIKNELHKYCNFYGNIDNENELNEVYRLNHILVVTSETESGPLVIMEAMARGLAIVTTEVGFVTQYLQNDLHGFKVDPFLPEEVIEQKMAAWIKEVDVDREKLAAIGTRNEALAYQRFGQDSFVENYRRLFSTLRNRQESDANKPSKPKQDQQ